MTTKLKDIALATLAASCMTTLSWGAEPMGVEPRPVGKIERHDPALDAIVDPNTPIEILAEGFEWSEGPVWWRADGSLLFSDIPRNTIFKWSEQGGLEEFLNPSGYTGEIPRGGELGSNGLAIDPQQRLVMCQHGDRRVARLESPLKPGTKPAAKFVTVADRWDGKRFNSPNDLVLHSNGAVYFTDPMYGLQKGGDPSTAEIDFMGVYRCGPDGKVTLATRAMTKPNGLAFSPDEKILYVGQSDSEAAIWRAFDVQADGTLTNERVFFDATDLVKQGLKGAPDGFKVDKNGNLLATGPGGVLVISKDGKHLGTISTGEAIANCAWGDDGGTLYMTSHMYLARVKTKTRGAGF
ncbi:SMP-30/gluconolactonase/LRE family protein [Lacipirellula limnantheis]|uniref:Gluconolactonase n=1 Tax=Lacipirellula limnantheis TaxID=2528024 RepID=A0A517U4U7_9BACT|nr:SMP-30/gluconolactonase/LRE family protein [Lacipirellula limnantheis]QDT75580.1 Gluconolactonase precursor [Lacipirellula limnantheis]